MIPRLIGCDFDGTLLRSDGTVSDRSRAALARVVAAGSRLVVVTGRPPRWMRQVAEETGHRGIALVANGGGVYDLGSETLLDSFPLRPPAPAEIATRLLTAVPDAVFAGEDGDHFWREPDYLSPYGDGNGTVVIPRADLLDRPLLKLLARTESLDADALLAVARARIGTDLATLTHSSSDGLLEISAAGVSKASGLARLAAEDGIDAADVVTFGDMPNDIPMLTWAGRSWAVANAHPAAREAAGAVTASNDEDGVAAVLEDLFG